MKKLNTSPISGMQEFLPATQATFNDIKAKIAKVYHLHGFQSIETPTIDRNEILFAKAGGDTEKQIYRVCKTTESLDSSNESLRFDHTVPLARYVVEHESELTFPFRVTQIGRNFRGERAQKGRFREFYQCDVDIIGRNELPIIYDAQVIFTFYEAVKSFLETPIRFRINNRKFLSGVLEKLGLSDKSDIVYSAIDHSDKVPESTTIDMLKDAGISEENVAKLITLINTHGTIDDILALDFIDADAPGIDELTTVMEELKALGLPESAYEIDLKIVRGLDYYTGTVFETILPDYPEIGSIGGGGRYDNLASNFTDQKFPGVGASIGLSRLFYVLNENNLLQQDISAPVDIAIIPLSPLQKPACYDLAQKLRATGKSVDLILLDKKLGDLLRHATRVAKAGIVVGENEVTTGNYKLKDFATGEQTDLTI